MKDRNIQALTTILGAAIILYIYGVFSFDGEHIFSLKNAIAIMFITLFATGSISSIFLYFRNRQKNS